MKIKKLLLVFFFVAICPSNWASSDTPINKIYGNWKSTEKNTISDEFITTKITENQWQESSGEMVPYKVVEISGPNITIEWAQESFNGSISRTSIIKVLDNGNIQLQWSPAADPIELKKTEDNNR